MRTARLWRPPAAIARAPRKMALGTTDTGVLLGVVLPLPSWPESFRPQALTWPSARSARLWPRPAATAMTFARPMTCAGVERWAQLTLIVQPSPSCPRLFWPHAQTLPFFLRASV